ncbi:tRNA wybutosine-synthesizing protein 3 homolog [Acropora palmata]|uniref:tRNA wybutosine-synthesizing protein 3 homolog n=1 Tax=Acropora palmata TaxID=6131 RepID=UPI003DA15989
MAASFQNQKVASLSQVDLSKKGSIDDQIIALVKYINEKEIFFTTSSCSGRIAVFSELADQRKKWCQWLYVTHEEADADKILCSLRECHGDAVFKFEPFVLHVQCRDLESGQQMLKSALVSGFKNSGIVIGKKGNVIVAVRSTQSLEVPLVHDGELLVSAEYIRFLVNVANKKLEENQTRIERFFTNLRDICEQNGSTTWKKSEKGGRQKQKDTRQNESPNQIINEGSSHLYLNANEQCSKEDVMDCLVSFYGDVS